MKPEQLIDIIKSFYSSFEAGDAEAAIGILSEDIVWENPMPETVPFGGRYEGRMEVAGYWGKLDETLNMGGMEIDQMIAQDDTVVVTGREKSLVKATDRTYDINWVHLFKVKSGQVFYVREYNNTAEMQQAFVCV